ncbi:MAG: hypothetical protein NUV75_02085 [Gallionella sp.]|nr:hypothetical protein [Gallionella sp.]
MRKYLTVLCVMLAGCAVAPRQMDYSLVDTHKVNIEQYQADYEECAALANQTSVGANAVAGVGVGAVIGGILGAVICGRECANQGAAFGAGYGGVSGAAGGVREQQGALRACLAGRGYNVIR